MCEIVCGGGYLVVEFDSVALVGFLEECWILLGCHHLLVVNCSVEC